MAKIVPPFVRSPYNYDVMAASDECALACLDESLAVQAERDECDINTIVRRFGLTGELPSGVAAPTYGDFTGVRDFKSAVDAVRSASESFMEMPPEIRSRFDNDPQKFVEFCSDDKNRAEAVKLGLVFEEPVAAAGSPAVAGAPAAAPGAAPAA